jgi:ATP-dependent helicase/nuclease subunit B
LKSDGSFYSSSSVVTPERWETLRREVRGRIRTIGADITDGKVDVAPYKLGKKTACEHCSYRPVCQFEPLEEEGGYRNLPLLGKEAVWEKLEGGVSGEK